MSSISKPKKSKKKLADEAANEVQAQLKPAASTAIDAADEKAWRASLDANGYVVISGILDDDNVERLKSLFYADLAALDTNIVRGNVSSHGNKNWPGLFSVGILKDAKTGMGQGRFLWECRKATAPFYRKLLRSKNILTSFDGWGAFRNYNLPELKGTRTKKPWLHVDQGSIIGDKANAYQGMLNFFPADMDTGGFIAVPGSHKRFKDTLATLKNPKGNYQLLDLQRKDVKELIASCGGPKLVRAGPGELIIWDSRVIHSNTHALEPSKSKDALLRLVAYVCFMPRERGDNTATRKTRDAFLEDGALANHWPIAPYMKRERIVYPRHKSFKQFTRSVALSKEVILKEYGDIAMP